MMIKKVLTTILTLLFSISILFAQNTGHKKIGIVLAGGGAKGVAHIGVLKVMEEAGIPIDYITGTSMGALVGALYSIGYSATELEVLVKNQDWMTLLSDKVSWRDRSQFQKMYGNVYTISLPFGVNRTKSKRTIEIPAGFIKGQNIMNLFSELTIGYHSHMSFDSLPIPFACVATNISTAQPYIFREGILRDAMRASMSIPGAFEPVTYKDSILLVDGGVVNNFPVDIAREMGAEITIGVDLDNGFKETEKIKNVVDIFEQLNEMLGYDSYCSNLKLLDLHIHPNLKEYSIASFTSEAVDSMIAIGERCARAHWDDLIKLKKMAGYDEGYMATHVQEHKMRAEESLFVSKINISGIDKRDEKWFRKIINLKDSSYITPGTIQEATNQAYATGNFSQVLYTIEGDGPYTLNFTLKQKPPRSIGLGFRFDSEVYAALLFNTTFKMPRINSTRFSLSGRLGENPWGELSLSFGDGFLRKVDLGYRIQYNDYSINYNGKRMASIINLNNRVYLKALNVSRGNFNFQAGLKYDHYKFRDIIAIRDTINEQINASGDYVTYQAGIQFNNLESYTFPRSGMILRINYDLLTNNFAKLYNKKPAHILSYKYTHIISLTNRVKFIPGIDGRIIFKEFRDTPLPFMNRVGGIENGRYVEQQIAMPGIKFSEIARNSILKLSANMRYDIGRGHHAEIGGAYLMNQDKFRDMIRSEGTWGIKAKYAYNAIFGPVSVVYSICDIKWKSSVYLSAGYYF